MRTAQTHAGFLLIQLMITLAILAALGGIAFVSTSVFRERQALYNSVDAASALINEAHGKTLVAQGGTAWGVHLDTNFAELFPGTSYSSGLTGSKIVPLDPAIEFDSVSLASGGSDIIFDPLTGDTADYGTFLVRRVRTAQGQKTVTVSKTGALSTN